MSQITIREIPPPLEAYIRKRAEKEGLSISKVVNEMLAEATGFSPDGKRFRDLSSLCGAWTAAEAADFQATQADFERIDRDAWE